MTGTRTTTWSAIGTDISNAKTFNDVLNISNLNYNVHREPIMLADGTVISDKFATVTGETNKRILGVVGKNYQICQNADAFSFIDSIENVKFVKAGETNTGMVYLIGQLPDVNVLGDTFTPYAIFQNGHNGMYTVKTTIMPLRIVCQNQYSWAFRESQNTISCSHTNTLKSNLRTAEKIIVDTASYMSTFNKKAETLAAKKCSVTKAIDLINGFFMKSIDEESSDCKRRNAEEKANALITAYKADDNQNFIGTEWGLVNAFADFNTHNEVKATKFAAESKFISVTFDTKMLAHFMSFAQIAA